MRRGYESKVMKLFELSCPNCGATLSDDLRCEMCGSKFVLDTQDGGGLTSSIRTVDNNMSFGGDGVVGPKMTMAIKRMTAYAKVLED